MKPTFGRLTERGKTPNIQVRSTSPSFDTALSFQRGYISILADTRLCRVMAMTAIAKPVQTNQEILNGGSQLEHMSKQPAEVQVQLIDVLHKDLQTDSWKPPPSAWTPQCHERAEEVGKSVEGYFLKNWLFPSQKSKAKFLKAGFPRVTCLYFPAAKDERIEYACRLLTVLFLIDGEADDSAVLESVSEDIGLEITDRGLS